MVVKRIGGWTFTELSALGRTTHFIGDSLTITENGWIKVWLRKKLVGVIRDWRSVTISAEGSIVMDKTPRS